jgi:hypothetical protein
MCDCLFETMHVALQHVVARPAPVLSKQLAYDVVKSGAPSDGDWDFVYAGETVALMPHVPVDCVHMYMVPAHSSGDGTCSIKLRVQLTAKGISGCAC